MCFARHPNFMYSTALYCCEEAKKTIEDIACKTLHGKKADLSPTLKANKPTHCHFKNQGVDPNLVLWPRSQLEIASNIKPTSDTAKKRGTEEWVIWRVSLQSGFACQTIYIHVTLTTAVQITNLCDRKILLQYINQDEEFKTLQLWSGCCDCCVNCIPINKTYTLPT